MDRFTLMHAFMTGSFVTLRDRTGANITGRIASIEREDGSGFCYNVNLYGHKLPMFVRCVKPE